MNSIAVNLGLTSVRYPDFARRNQFMRALLDHIHSMPGVVAAGVSNRMPLSGEGQNFPVLVEGADASVGEQPIVDYRCVNPDLFRAGCRAADPAQQQRDHPRKND